MSLLHRRIGHEFSGWPNQIFLLDKQLRSDESVGWGCRPQKVLLHVRYSGAWQGLGAGGGSSEDS
jgi:hypothetical protein